MQQPYDNPDLKKKSDELAGLLLDIAISAAKESRSAKTYGPAMHSLELCRSAVEILEVPT